MLETTYLASSFGYFKIIGSKSGIRSIRLTDDEIPKELPKTKYLNDCVVQLNEYFARKRESFDLQLDWEAATDFNKQVWAELLKIPYGRTCSYGDIAERIDNPKAVRAVGLANRNNPIPIIVPCHRVIAKSGKLHGYFSGLDMKMRLLQLENPDSYALQASLF